MERTFQHAMYKDQRLILLWIAPVQPLCFYSITKEKVLSHNFLSNELSKEIAVFTDSCIRMITVYVKWEIVVENVFLNYL